METRGSVDKVAGNNGSKGQVASGAQGLGANDLAQVIVEAILRNISPDGLGRLQVILGDFSVILDKLKCEIAAASADGAEFQLRCKDQKKVASEATNPPQPPRSPGHPGIVSAEKYVREDLRGALTTGAVARRVGLSPVYFCRLFRQQTGHSFSTYVAKRRVEFARQLLLDSSKSVKEIAFLSGFGSIAQFNRIFKRTMGITPGAVRRTNPIAQQ